MVTGIGHFLWSWARQELYAHHFALLLQQLEEPDNIQDVPLSLPLRATEYFFFSVSISQMLHEIYLY